MDKEMFNAYIEKSENEKQNDNKPVDISIMEMLEEKGIRVKKTDGTFRTFGAVIDEISEKYSPVADDIQNLQKVSGIKIMNDDKTYKPFGEVLDAIRNNWLQYSSEKRENIISVIIGDFYSEEDKVVAPSGVVSIEEVKVFDAVGIKTNHAMLVGKILKIVKSEVIGLDEKQPVEYILSVMVTDDCILNLSSNDIKEISYIEEWNPYEEEQKQKIITDICEKYEIGIMNQITKDRKNEFQIIVDISEHWLELSEDEKKSFVSAICIDGDNLYGLLTFMNNQVTINGLQQEAIDMYKKKTQISKENIERIEKIKALLN
ncbi:MAG TPA: hypothetical protein IAC41_01395 [Candidatus Merdenecus merdavium]|nr:hypothetical protein [Candidatus Merdenecus merdavium]